MRDNELVFEISALTIEEAIETGLAEMGLNRESVEVEIIEEGSRGLFGLGTRQARVRLTKIVNPLETQAQVVTEQPISASKEAPSEALPLPQKSVEPTIPNSALNANDILEIAEETVRHLLEKMFVQADVSARFGEPTRSGEQAPVWVDILGNDLSILIGRRAETLNALQYIAGLIINKEIGNNIHLIVDVEGYRVRREHQLKQLAHRMADQAIKTGRRQVLEPMAANERRIIHIELRNHEQIKTESIGDEPNRKVTIIPL